MEIKYVKVRDGNWYSAEDFIMDDYSYEVSSPMFRVSFDGDFSNDNRYRYALMCDYNSGTKEWKVFFIDSKEEKELELAEEVKSKCLELAKREMENFDKMTFTERYKDFDDFSDYCMDEYCALLKDFYGYGDEDAYKDIENEYNSMLKELNDKLYAKYKNKLNQV